MRLMYCIFAQASNHSICFLSKSRLLASFSFEHECMCSMLVRKKVTNMQQKTCLLPLLLTSQKFLGKVQSEILLTPTCFCKMNDLLSIV